MAKKESGGKKKKGKKEGDKAEPLPDAEDKPLAKVYILS